MTLSKWQIMLATAAWCVPSVASATVILQDTFNRGTVPSPAFLNGSAPTQAQTAGDTWTAYATSSASTSDYTDDTEANIVGNGSNGTTALLPFVNSSSSPGVYVLNFTLDPGASNSTSTGWIAAGFAANTSYTTRSIQSDGAGPWVLLRGNGQLYFFVNSATYDPSSPSQLTAGAAETFYISLDTTGADDVANFYVGVYGGAPAYSFTYTGSAGATPNPTVNYVAMSGFSMTGGTESNLQVTETPEPMSLAILAAGAITLLSRRRIS